MGNIKPIGTMPEGTVICCLEEKAGDRGSIARASGDYCIIVAHNPDAGVTRVKLPSGSKKVCVCVATWNISHAHVHAQMHRIWYPSSFIP